MDGAGCKPRSARAGSAGALRGCGKAGSLLQLVWCGEVAA